MHTEEVSFHHRMLLILGLLLPLMGHAQQTSVPVPLTVNWYHGASFLQPVIDAFTLDTGVAVKVTSDYDTFSTEVILVSDYKHLTEAKKLGHFMTLELAEVERNVPARWRDRDGYWTGVVLRARAPIYNKAAVRPADVLATGRT